MSREYTRDWYLERIAWIKAAKREISMTSDIIVGFPGETEQDLEDTATLLEEVGYDAVFAFKYSPRPNTPAIGMADSIPGRGKVAAPAAPAGPPAGMSSGKAMRGIWAR